MAYYLIDDFRNGLDLRRSSEMAVAGTVRELTNAAVNEGGEIEKRKAFVLEETLTAYAQNPLWKGKVNGPFEVPGYPESVFFRHNNNSLPGGAFVSGSGTLAQVYTVGSGYGRQRFWIMRNGLNPGGAIGGMYHAMAWSHYADNCYTVDGYYRSDNKLPFTDHCYVDFTGEEPTAQTSVSTNDGRVFQKVLKTKGYVINGDVLYASAVGDPTDMGGTGSGQLDLSTQGASIGTAISMADYYGELAVFGRRGVQFYSLDPDFAKNQYLRRLEAPLFAPRSVVGYGDGDVVFLARDGIRSLQARDSSNLAKVTDIGSPIDKLIVDALAYSTEAEAMFDQDDAIYPIADFYNVACGIVHPDSGQLWMAIKDKIYVYSKFGGSRVAGWSVFDLPTPSQSRLSPKSGTDKSRWVADMCRINDTVVMRNFADEIFVYGGATGEQYDETEAVVVTPFLDMGTPGDVKYFSGLDLVCEGEWTVEASCVPVPDQRNIPWVKIAVIDGRTRAQARVPFQMQGTQIALRFTSRSAYAARLAQVCIYFEGGAQK
jgi:hypothetical protein